MSPRWNAWLKAKQGRKYEFGCKVSIVLTHREGLALNCMAHHGNPYDGHTLEQALSKAEQVSGKKISQAFADRGGTRDMALRAKKCFFLAAAEANCNPYAKQFGEDKR
ncbi:MAG: transposase [Parachlamydia sp.]|nr:transposase [Parachlamydia sp.]